MSEFLDLHDDAVSRRVLFTIAALMVTVPFVQAGAQIWPLQLSNIQWRFGAANALSGILLLPFLGLSILLVMARGLDRPGMAKIVGAASALFTLVLLASLAVFVLDAQELKNIVSSAMAAQFSTTTARVAVVTAVHMAAYGLLAIYGFSALPGTKRGPTVKRAKGSGSDAGDDDSPLIVGR